MIIEDNTRIAIEKIKNVKMNFDKYRAILLAQFVPESCSYPSHWEKTKISKAGLIKRGFYIQKVSESSDQKYSILQSHNLPTDGVDVHGGGINVQKVKQVHLTDQQFQNYRLNLNDILVSDIVLKKNESWPVLYSGVPVNAVFDQGLFRFRAADQVLPEFALMVFRRHMHGKVFRKNSRGSLGWKHITTSRLNEIEFPIPPAREQLEMVEEIRQKLERIRQIQATLSNELERIEDLQRCLDDLLVNKNIPNNKNMLF